MSDRHDEKRVYRLSSEGEWAFMQDFVPEKPWIPDTLLPLYPTGKTVEEVDDLDLYVSAHGDKAPSFVEDDQAVEATPQEMAEWRAAWASMEQAQQAFRDRLGEARTAYETAAHKALADLTQAMKPWASVEATLKARSAELAATLHSHRTAAEEWAQKQEEEKQAQLDAIHGPRAIVLYAPKRLSSHNTADHIARVHLVDCKRRAKLHAPIGRDRHADEGLRADEAWHRLTNPNEEAWHRLTNPNEWAPSAWGDFGDKMRVKFCSFCKPWTVFEEHIEDFPRPRINVLGTVRLTDVPEAWSASLMTADDEAEDDGICVDADWTPYPEHDFPPSGQGDECRRCGEARTN